MWNVEHWNTHLFFSPRSRSRSRTSRRMEETAYSILRVEEDADSHALKSAYKERMLEAHPDKGGDQAHFESVQKAWSLVSTPSARAAYDAHLSSSRSGLLAAARLSDTVEIDDMDLREIDDGLDLQYAHPCRCGGEYVLLQSQIDALFTSDPSSDPSSYPSSDPSSSTCVVPCSGCSLKLSVLIQD